MNEETRKLVEEAIEDSKRFRTYIHGYLQAIEDDKKPIKWDSPEEFRKYLLSKYEEFKEEMDYD